MNWKHPVTVRASSAGIEKLAVEFIRCLSDEDYESLGDLIHNNRTDVAADMAEDHGYPRSIVEVLTTMSGVGVSAR